MKFYFKRGGDTATRLKANSYAFLTVGLVALAFYFIGDTSDISRFARLLMIVSFAACACFSIADICMEIKKNRACNVYDLIRAVVSSIMCIVAATCIDRVLL